jgi:class 3 adenylate cyclase/tetratricopeptide (TPR) repeat protein
MTGDIGTWLDGLGLSIYADLFRAHDIDLDVLADFTVDELRDLGVSIGNAKRIVRDLATKAAAPVRAIAPLAERHQLSIVFCDLVGSATISEQLDAEDLRTLLDQYYRCCESAAHDHGGHVGKVIGDGVQLYFGYPTAIEHSATAAVEAALDVLAAVEAMNDRQPSDSARLGVRVGVHTGVAVVGEVGGAEGEIIGDLPVIAARIQGVAEPGSAVVTEATARQLSDDFVLCDAGMHQLKGLSTPVHAYSAARRSHDESRYGAVSTRLEGRDAELAGLRARWKLAARGRGQVVHIVGDAGIGKSELARAATEGVPWRQIVEFRCSPHRSGTPLWPIIDRFRRMTGIRGADHDGAGVTQLRKYIDAELTHPSSEEHLAIFAAMLRLAPAQTGAIETWTSDQLREGMLQAVIERLIERSRRSPLVVRLEDIQWADPTTRELLGSLVQQVPKNAILLLVISRPGFEAPWRSTDAVASMRLHGLNEHDARAVIHRVAGSTPVPPSVVERILALTDGVPLFVEELTRTVLEAGQDITGAHASVDADRSTPIPSTLRDSLWARLDRLGPLRDLAQVASVIGREFTVGMLAGVVERDALHVRTELDQLHTTGLIQLRDTGRSDWFMFRHALVQSAAYDSLLRSRRRELHGRVAVILEQATDELVDNAEPLARHLDLAGRHDDALIAYMRVGDQVAATSSHEEALGHYRRALDLAEHGPRDRVGLERRLAVHSAIRNALVVLRGYAADEVAEECVVARRLCDELGDSEQLFPVLWNLAGFHMLRGEHDASERINETLLEIAAHSDDETLALLAHGTVGQTKHYQGRFDKALFHLGECVRRYDAGRHGELALRYAEEDPGAAALAYGAVTLWIVGLRSESRRWMDEAVTLSTSLPYRTTQSLVISVVTQLAYFRSDVTMLDRVLPQLEDLVGKHDLGFANPTAQCNLGWAHVAQGDVAGGVDLLRTGIARLSSSGALATNPFAVLFLADGLLRAGRPDEVCDIVETTLQTVRARGERVLEAELLRVSGEAHAAAGKSTALVKDRLVEACVVAETLGARSLRLCAAVSLAERNLDAGRATLTAALGAIESDLDDADARAARALLDR